MNQKRFRAMSLTLLTGLLVAGLLYAQTDSAKNPTEPSEEAEASLETPTIFCPTMKTGQLCSHGTAAALKLDGEKKERWVEAARRYNKAVDAATIRLLEDAKAVLSPQELALVEAWFAKGLNPEINRILSTR